MCNNFSFFTCFYKEHNCNNKNMSDNYNDLSCVVEEQSKISSLDSCVNPTFDDETDTTMVYEYIQKHETRYTPYIDELKSGAVKIRNNEVANKIFGDLYGVFEATLDSVEIFNVIIEYFGFSSKEYFNKLVSKYRMILITDLSKRVDLGVDIDKLK